jgi:hypothetical protein
MKLNLVISLKFTVGLRAEFGLQTQHRESSSKCFDFANGEKFNTGTMPGSQTLLE